MAKFTDQSLKADLLDALSSGLTQKDACRLAGVGLSTFHNWMARGEMDAEGEYRDFRRAVRAAQAAFKRRNLDVIQRAALDEAVEVQVTKVTDAEGRELTKLVRKTIPPRWTAAAWLLERRFPAEFAVRQANSGDEEESGESKGVAVEMVFDDGEGGGDANSLTGTAAEGRDADDFMDDEVDEMSDEADETLLVQ